MSTQEASADSADTAEETATVLFVDDEPDLLEIYEVLCGSEYEVFTAESGTEAIDRFGDHIDIAFFDRRMPEMTGDEAIRTLREQGYQTPIGIISAVDADNDVGVDHAAYLTKPVERDDVLTTIDEHT